MEQFIKDVVQQNLTQCLENRASSQSERSSANFG